MLAGLLGHIHKSPDVLKRGCGRDLNGNILAVLHRIEGDRNVMLPVSTDVNKVDVVTVAKLFVGLCASGISGGLRESSVFQCLLSLFDTVGLHVTECSDLHARDVGVTLHSAGATHSDADKGDPDSVHRRDGQPKHVLLTGRTGWGLNLDRAFFLRSGTGYRQSKR